MSTETENLHVEFASLEGNELVIRHGNAEPIHTPGPLHLSGNFNAPAEFVGKRVEAKTESIAGVPNNKSHVIFNEKALSITLVVNEQGRDTITVTGSLKKNPFLESLQINGNAHSNRSLLELIRYKGHLFASREEHKKLVLALQHFDVSTNTNVRDVNDRQGTKEISIVEKAKTALSGTSVTLNVPLFEGEEKAQISFTVEVEPNNGSVLIFLVSETFEEFYDTAVKALFATQRPTFEPFVIIEK